MQRYGSQEIGSLNPMQPLKRAKSLRDPKTKLNLATLFSRLDDQTDEARIKVTFFRGACTSLLCLLPVVIYLLVLFITDDESDTDKQTQALIRFLNASAFFLFILILVIYVHCAGITTMCKVSLMLFAFLTFILEWLNSSHSAFYFLIIPLSMAFALATHRDSLLLSRIAYVEWAVFIIVITLEIYDIRTNNLNLHLWGRSQDHRDQWGIIWLSHVVPTSMMFFLLKNYVESVRTQEQQAIHAVLLAHRIADSLANYDLKAAQDLLEKCDKLGDGIAVGSVAIKEPLSVLLSNLVSYQSFLPHSLFKKESKSLMSLPDEDLPNIRLVDLCRDKDTSWDCVDRAVTRMQDPKYRLRDFHEDMVKAFPELVLYFDSSEGNDLDRKRTWMASGLDAADEYQRTLGALYAVYCFLRLHLDGKEVFSFGVDEEGWPRKEAVDPDAEKKTNFYHTMPWNAVTDLMVRSEMLERQSNGETILKRDRVSAMLSLTAIHDIMKNTNLQPIVQSRHAPYRGYVMNDQIGDHDVALEYILEHYPTLLPTFRGLQPKQRAPILFTQGKMSFNNGWLVQGEAPPGALFTKFKQVISEGCASRSDIDFYFVHWLTDLAGAEPFGERSWPGAEKFSTKFPVKVLGRFLDSFGFVDSLATRSEVEVMEEYLVSRWTNFGPFVLEHPECEVAAMRLSLMAQGFEAEIVHSFQSLSVGDRTILAEEMARTGCRDQFRAAPASLKTQPAGPALLVYYAPALLQKAKAAKSREALSVLAAVFRAGRALFPLRADAMEETVTIRIDVLKVLDPVDIVNGDPWHVKRTSAVDAEAAPGEARDAKSITISLISLNKMISL